MNRPARLALGVVVLVAERVRRGPVPGAAMAAGVGLVEQTAAGVRAYAGRAVAVTTRVASRSLTALPAGRIRARLSQVTAQARRHGEATIAGARAEATAFASSGLTWTQTRGIPQFIDGLLPHLIDRVLPEIRLRVIPVLIEDLARDARIRDLVLHGGEQAVSGAAQHLRDATAGADDRIEAAVRRFGRRVQER